MDFSIFSTKVCEKMTFHFSEAQSPGISPALWDQADGYNHALSPTLHKRKSHRGKGPNVKPLAIFWHCGDNQKVEKKIALHLSPALSS